MAMSGYGMRLIHDAKEAFMVRARASEAEAEARRRRVRGERVGGGGGKGKKTTLRVNNAGPMSNMKRQG
jgi:hypothetical protein